MLNTNELDHRLVGTDIRLGLAAVLYADLVSGQPSVDTGDDNTAFSRMSVQASGAGRHIPSDIVFSSAQDEAGRPKYYYLVHGSEPR